MRAASELSLEQAETLLREAIESGAPVPTRIAEDLFGLSDLVRTNSRLRRALTDPSRPGEDKKALAASAFGNAVRPESLRIVNTLAQGHWSDPMDLHDALEILGIEATLEDARDQGKLGEVEAEIFAVSELLTKNRDLRNALSDLGRSNPHERAELAQSIFSPHVSPWTMRLLRRAVGRSTHGRLLANLRRFAERAASLQDRRLVTVTAASPMTAAQVDRLSAIIAKRLGQAVTINVSIDPDLVGGFRLTTGDVAVDSSVRTQVADLKRALAR